MAVYQLTIRRKDQSEIFNFPIEIHTKVGVYQIKNGAEIKIYMPEGENTFVFCCDKNPTIGKETFIANLNDNSTLEISCSGNGIVVDGFVKSSSYAKTYEGSSIASNYYSYGTQCKEKERRKIGNPFVAFWESNTAMITASVILAIIFTIVFSRSLMEYSISLVCSAITVLVIAKFSLKIDIDVEIIGRLILIILVIAIILTLPLIYCDFSDSSDSSSSNEPCGICGGTGTVVNSKFLGEGEGIQYGFDMIYRCKYCHGTGSE